LVDHPEVDAVLGDLSERLWSGGLTEPLIAIEQIAFFMLLKRLDVAEKRGEARNAFAGHGRLRWDELRSAHPSEQIAILEKELTSLLIQVGGRAFLKAQLAIFDPKVVEACMRAIDQLGFDEMPLAYQGEVFEDLLERLQGTGSGIAGQLRTPGAVARLMTELADPRPGETVCDPAAGTGGLLVEAARHIGAGMPGFGLTLTGYDLNPGMARLTALNLLFHGIEEPMVEQANSLSADFPLHRYDVIVSSPPFGVALSKEINPRLSHASARTELAFLELCRLMQGGRVAILVPESLLFAKSPDFVGVRQRWLEERRVEAVVLLPPQALLPHSGVRTAILLASRGETETVWFCQLDGEGDGEDQLAAAAGAIKAVLADHEPSESGEQAIARDMFPVAYDNIRRHEWSLSPSLYRPAPRVEEELQHPARLMEEALEIEGEINRMLDEARSLLTRIE
jgi:type I restriction enzyme M protein